MQTADVMTGRDETVVVKTLASLFAAVCACHRERTALSVDGREMTYAELEARSARVAAGLKARGVGRGCMVGICLERGFDMVVAMLGVVRAGAAYLPLDVRYPTARLRETVEDAGPAMVVVEKGAELAGVSVEELDGRWQGDPPVAAEDRAYVIYTSGSTGKPKGVEVKHANVAALLRGTEELFGFDEQDVWTMFHSFAFDFSVWEMWGCLLSGGRLVIVPFETSRAPDEFWKLLVRERVTVLNQTPSAFALLDRVDASESAGALALRVVIFGGEALAGSALRGWFGRHGDAQPRLVNMYGITETTVHVTYRRMRVGDGDERESLIGEPIAGWTLDLEDGEIVVGGAGVARGYLHRAELTAERFVGGRYRSGDMARRREDGELVYLGRRDGQVKINGFRIELGEVEAALRGCAGVEQACVVARENRLIGYVVGGGTDVAAQVAARLPAQMRPSLYVPVAAMPLNANGKIDRAALPEPGLRAGAPDPARDPAAGSGSGMRTPMEKIVGEVWVTVLGADAGLHENFFDAGGLSLSLIAVRAGLQERLGRAIPVTWMFECTTVSALAKRLEEGAAATQGNSNAARQRQAFARARELRGAAR